MKTSRHFFFLGIFICIANLLIAQNAPITQPQLMYTKSNMFAIGINSFKSRGAYYRLGWHKTGKEQSHWEIDISRVRHPKEERRPGNTESQTQYTFGRLNVVYLMRNSIGQTIAITERPYKNAVGLNFVYDVGITMAFIKPVYIEVYYQYENTPSEGYLVSEKYNPEKHTDIFRIFGNAPFTKGLSETNIQFGGFGRAGFQVEWGQYSDEMKCLEAGITMDGFAQGIPIMAHTTYDKILLGFYVSYNWGNRK